MQTQTDYNTLWSETWGDMQDIGAVHRHMGRLILDRVRPLQPREILDVGCGNGSLLALLHRELELTDLTGIDISAEALQMTRRRVPGTFIECDVTKKPLDRRFDLVVTNQVIEHIPDDKAFVEGLYAMTGRYCLVGTIGRMRPSEAKIGHLRNYSRQGLEGMMRRAGFVIEKTIEWGFPFYSPLYRSAVEVIGGNAVKVGHRLPDRVLAGILYQLYRLNSSRRGDVLMVLASRRS